MDYAKLKAVLAGEHPSTGAYSENAEEAAAQGNLANVEVDVETITDKQLFEAIVPADYIALTDRQASTLHMLIGMGTIAVKGPNVRLALATMFQDKPTLDVLIAMQKQMVSHFESESLPHVYPGHIETARRIP